MENNKEPWSDSKQGTGSAEQTGRDRKEQQHQHTDLSGGERRNMADEMGNGPNPITTVREMGGMSGRDDASGGSGDRMEDQSTGQGTDR